MILLTGAAGKTGKTILQSLAKVQAQVRCLVRSPEQAALLNQEFKVETIMGDLTDHASLESAVDGVSSIYYICPNVSPFEVETGEVLLRLAKRFGVQHFVYHSVLHPQIEAMPHHWQKMRMEERIFASHLPFTILQPCAYMQNILANWTTIIESGVYSVPYNLDARISIVDLKDVAEVVARVLTEGNHAGSIYELAGPEPLNQFEIAAILSKKLEKPIEAVEWNRHQWENNARHSGIGDKQVSTLMKMFEYYDQNGLVGNPFVLNTLLKRPATTFAEFVDRTLVTAS